jgi:branched-chain amino acid transport system substrate-binding protein
MSRSNAFLSLLAVLVAASCSFSSPDPRPSAVTEVEIGLLAPLSGRGSKAGADVQRGAELAAALVNGEVGPVQLAGAGGSGLSGLGGAKVKLVPADTRGDVTVGSTAAATLVNKERVVGIVGAYDANVTASASQRTERLRVPFVNGDTSADFLTERGLDWFFRVGPTDRKLGEMVLSTLRQLEAANSKIRTERVGIVFADDAPSNGTVASTLELVDEGSGFRVVAQEGFAPGGDPVGALQRVRAESPDTVFLIASRGEDARRAVEAAAKLGGGRPGIFTLGAGFLDPATRSVTGRVGDRLFHGTVWSGDVASRNPAAKPLMDSYQQRFQAPMSEVAATSFTAVLMLAAAVNDAGSIDPARVRAALLGLDISGRDTIMPWEGVRFDASQQNSRSSGVVEQLVEGRRRVVFPSELVEGNGAVWPVSGD